MQSTTHTRLKCLAGKPQPCFVTALHVSRFLTQSHTARFLFENTRHLCPFIMFVSVCVPRQSERPSDGGPDSVDDGGTSALQTVL